MPRKPKRQLHNLKVREVSLVDDGDNPGARVLLFKRKEDPFGTIQVSKLNVQTSRDDDHAHVLEVPDGAIASGRFRTNEANGHTHDFDVPDVQPGQNTDLQSSEANGHTHSVSIKAVESKRTRPRKKGVQMRLIDTILDAIRSWSGKEPDEELEKRLFDEIRAESLNEQIADAVLSRVHDLARSVRESMFMVGDDRPDPQGAIAESLKQFAETMDEDLANIFAGRIIKAVGEIDDVQEKPDEEEIEKILQDLFTVDTSQADNAGATKEESMDLSKLSKEDRDKVAAALDAAGSVEEFAKNFKGLADLVTGAAASQTELDKLKGKPEDDPLKDLPEEVRKIVDERVTKLSDENATLKGRLDTFEADRKRETFEQSVGNLAGLPQKREEIVEALWTMTDDDQRSKMQKNLEAAAEAARRGNLFNEIGSGMSEGGSAYAQIVAKAEEIRKATPSLTEAAARAQAMNENPDLYDQYLEEDTPQVN